AGPLGYREIAAHGHADALSFTLSLGGVEMLVDPGTFAYHTEAQWRGYFRGTSAHNTVRIDGEDQSQPGGNFMWLRKANAACSTWEEGAQRDLFEGWHDGYGALADPVIHRRRITLEKPARVVTLEDTLEMSGAHDVELFLHCAEGSRVEPNPGGYSVTRDGQALRVTLPELPGGSSRVLHGSESPIGGWVSRRFDRKVAAPTLVWTAHLSGPHMLRTLLRCE
ncbi:MAG TPA: heparinase II/III-family protein, partial [Steroidobacteraceae bacterium]|nr:heparinase II/III-family protein [Steroidobacteraceae bacterium]